MPYQLPVTTITLNFTNTIFDGAEVKLKGDVSTGFVIRMESLAKSGNVEQGSIGMTEFGDKVLIEWNLHDEYEKPIPATGQGMLDISAKFAGEILHQWVEAVTQPSAPLSPRSSVGTTGEPTPTMSEVAEMIGSPAELNLSDFSKQS